MVILDGMVRQNVLRDVHGVDLPSLQGMSFQAALLATTPLPTIASAWPTKQGTDNC